MRVPCFPMCQKCLRAAAGPATGAAFTPRVSTLDLAVDSKRRPSPSPGGDSMHGLVADSALLFRIFFFRSDRAADGVVAVVF